MFTIDKKNRRLSKNEKNQFKKDGYLTGLPVFDKSAKADLDHFFTSLSTSLNDPYPRIIQAYFKTFAQAFSL